MAIVKQWREAASVILVSRSFIKTPSAKFDCSFKVLTLKRNSKTFMPDSYVFPGGAVDKADSSTKWLELFSKFGFKPHQFPTVPVNSTCPLFLSDIHADEGVSKSLSLRIAAIRETFEESGVLLCKNSTITKEKSSWVSYLAGCEVQKWQNRVQEDPHQFIDLCTNFDCYPDIWSLHLWSNWLTPIQHPKRFDTAFFVAVCDQLPPVYIDNSEVVEFKWCSPHELLSLCNNGEILLQPPQYYEMARLYNYDSIHKVVESAAHINSLPCEQWMPVQIKTTNGFVSFLPGDHMYPANPDKRSGKPLTFDGEMADLRLEDNPLPLHRFELQNPHNMNIVVENFEPSNLSNNVLPRSLQM